MKEGYVQRAWEENRGWESGSKQGRRICHWKLLIRRPINQFFQQQIIQSSLPVLCLSTPAISSKHTHLSLSLQGFATWLYRNIWLISLKKKNTKTTVKVSVRCIFIHSRTQLYGGPLRIQESLSRGGPYSCNLQGLWLFVISLIVFVWSSKEIKNKFFLIVWKMFGKRNCPFYCHCVII